MTVFDPLIHLQARPDMASEQSRWVLCRRPMVKVGGEMRWKCWTRALMK